MFCKSIWSPNKSSATYRITWSRHLPSFRKYQEQNAMKSSNACKLRNSWGYIRIKNNKFLPPLARISAVEDTVHIIILSESCLGTSKSTRVVVKQLFSSTDNESHHLIMSSIPVVELISETPSSQLMTGEVENSIPPNQLSQLTFYWNDATWNVTKTTLALTATSDKL